MATLGQSGGRLFGSRARENLSCRKMRKLEKKIKNQEEKEGFDATIVLHKEDSIYSLDRYVVEDENSHLYTAYGKEWSKEEGLGRGDVVRVKPNGSDRDTNIQALITQASKDPKAVMAVQEKAVKYKEERDQFIKDHSLKKKEGTRKWVKEREFEATDKVQEETKSRADRKPPSAGRGRGRGREDIVSGRPAKDVGRAQEDGGPKDRGRGGSTSKPIGGRGGGRGRG